MGRIVGEVKKLPFELSISRPVWGDGRKAISLRLTDVASGIQFFDGEVSLENFMEALTGLGNVPGEAELRGLDDVGKKFVSERRSALMPPKMSRDEAKTYLLTHCQEPGWRIDTYLGSKSSFEYLYASDRYKVNYRVFKYVDPVQAEETL